MDSNPQFQCINQIPPGLVAVEQPLVVLLENGPGFSVLIASHLGSEPDGSAVILEDCTQFRIEEDGRELIRSFERVAFTFNNETECWIASPDEFESLFSQPSADPYVVLPLSREHGVALEQMISAATLDKLSPRTRSATMDTIFRFFLKRFGSKPHFYAPSDNELRTPRNYADRRWNYPNPKRYL